MSVQTWIWIAALALAGCKGHKKAENAPSCRQIVSYMMRFPEFGTFDERVAIEQCRQQKWNPEQRRCLYGAKDVESMSKCVPAVKVQPSTKPAVELPPWHPHVDEPIVGASSGSAAPESGSAAPAPAPSGSAAPTSGSAGSGASAPAAPPR